MLACCALPFPQISQGALAQIPRFSAVQDRLAPVYLQMTDNKLILILGDQLSLHNPALQAARPGTDIIVMAEVREEANYVPHNRHKIALIFSAATTRATSPRPEARYPSARLSP